MDIAPTKKYMEQSPRLKYALHGMFQEVLSHITEARLADGDFSLSPPPTYYITLRY